MRFMSILGFHELNMTIDLNAISSIPSSPTFLPALRLVLCLPLWYLWYKYLTAPLNKIPGPSLSSLTSLWLVRETYRRRRHFSDLELHKRYGPIVRIGPREISLSSPAAVKAIYGELDESLLSDEIYYPSIH